MKTSFIKMVFRLLLAVIITGNFSLAQEKETDKQEMMKKYLAASMPGEAHTKLDNLVGSWDIATTIWMDGPATDNRKRNSRTQMGTRRTIPTAGNKRRIYGNAHSRYGI
jgi:hypothetical protein